MKKTRLPVAFSSSTTRKQREAAKSATDLWMKRKPTPGDLTPQSEATISECYASLGEKRVCIKLGEDHSPRSWRVEKYLGSIIVNTVEGRGAWWGKFAMKIKRSQLTLRTPRDNVISKNQKTNQPMSPQKASLLKVWSTTLKTKTLLRKIPRMPFQQRPTYTTTSWSRKTSLNHYEQ